MKPSIGRIVHFINPRGGAVEAALIARIDSYKEDEDNLQLSPGDEKNYTVTLYCMPPTGRTYVEPNVRFTDKTPEDNEALGRWMWPGRVAP